MKENKLILVFPVREDRVLLGLKKRGFGEGYWNGFGGKIEDGETKIEALIRECREEAGIKPISFLRVAKLNFFNARLIEQHHHNFVYIYLCDKWRGRPAETEEMQPKWFSKNSLPLDSMWPPDRLWLPQILNGDFLKGDIFLDKSGQPIDSSIVKVAEL